MTAETTNRTALLRSWPQRNLAVVIGAGGMSMAVARRLGQHNDLLLADIDASKLELETAKLTDEGLNVEAVVCDVTSPESVAVLASRVERHGGFRILAHVAGLSPSLADWQTIMAVNLIGPALVTEALKAYVTSGTVAVLISSLSAHMRPTQEDVLAVLDRPLEEDFWERLSSVAEEVTPQLSYMLSKVGVIRLSERLALSWGGNGGRVISLSPGLIASPQGLNEFKHSSAKFDLLQQCPLQRQGNMQEIADVVEFLTSDRASYISGIDLLVDGGVRAALRHS